MAAVLYYGEDKRFVEILQPFFRNHFNDAGEANSILHVKDKKGLDEALIAMAFDVILLEQNFLDGSAIDWLASLRQKRSSIKSKFILCGDETDSLKIMKILESGFIDYMTFPPDKPLLIEKMFLYADGDRKSEMRQVYSLQMSEPADVAKPGIIEELSEFDCKVRSLNPVLLGEIMVLYSATFGGTTAVRGSILARCYKTGPHPLFKDQYLSQYNYVGVTTEALKNIRNSLRKSWVSAKQK